MIPAREWRRRCRGSLVTRTGCGIDAKQIDSPTTDEAHTKRHTGCVPTIAAARKDTALLIVRGGLKAGTVVPLIAEFVLDQRSSDGWNG